MVKENLAPNPGLVVPLIRREGALGDQTEREQNQSCEKPSAVRFHCGLSLRGENDVSLTKLPFP